MYYYINNTLMLWLKRTAVKLKNKSVGGYHPNVKRHTLL